MKKVLFLLPIRFIFPKLALLLLGLFPAFCAAQYTERDIVAYIDRYKDLAIKKMYEYKIPASITLAQGIFESACGTSRLAVEGNNHFGIKCHTGWTGDTVKIDDDELQECFRKYDKIEDSYNDHSLFLTTRSRYAQLFKLDIMDYKAWARGLKAAGYATNPKYADRLINLIERFNLAYQDTVYQQRLQSGYFTNPQQVQMAEQVKTQPKRDSQELVYTPKDTPKTQETKHVKPAKHRVHVPSSRTTVSEKQTTTYVPKTSSNPKSVPAQSKTADLATSSSFVVFTAIKSDFPKEEYPFTSRQVYVNNRTFFVIARKGDTYAKIAEEVQSTEKNIRKYNDMGKHGEPCNTEVVYIENKSKKGNVKEHVVKKGETLRYISQRYAVQLEMIFHYNQLTEKSIIHPGDRIKLQ